MCFMTPLVEMKGRMCVYVCARAWIWSKGFLGKKIIYSAYFWKVGKRVDKEIFVFILYSFVLNFILPKAHTDFKMAY